MSPRRDKITVCHVAMADLWAGAEVQLAILLSHLSKMSDLEIIGIFFNEGRLAREVMDLGIKTHVILESRYGPISILKQLSDCFRHHPIDILHTHKYKDNILGAISSVCQRIRWRVRTIHGSPEPLGGFPAVKAKIYEIVDNGVNRWLVDRILAVSLDLRSQLTKHFGAEKVICVHNSIDIGQMRVSGCAAGLRKELKLSEQEFVIGTIGRLMPVKGLNSFLKAARIICRQRPNVKFIIAGDGPLAGSLHAVAHECGVDKDVLFLGHRNDSHEILNLMDLFVLPSLSEGVPMALLEALALGRPVVASRVGGIPEVIEHGVNGLLVTPGSEEELARNCIALMDDYGSAQRLGEAGRKQVKEKFSAKIMAERVAEVYRSLVWNEGSR